jgi:hypothetical protein
MIRIDLDKLLDRALQGVRRASVFMGLGVNAALDPNFKNYQLSRLTSIQIVPDDVSDEGLSHFKEEFRLWIEAGGFRELTETFASYLDSLCHTRLVLQAVRRKKSGLSIEEAHAKFRSEGFPKKLNILAQRFQVGPAHRDHLLSLNRARNCLTHRRGIVGVEDTCGEVNCTVAWRGLDISSQDSGGERHYMNAMPEGGILLSEGASIMAPAGRKRTLVSSWCKTGALHKRFGRNLYVL